MADTRNTSLLETFLSISGSKAELLSQLELREVRQLSLTCKSIYTLFKQPLGAAKLLNFVIKAEWDEMEKLIALNPSFMFQPANGIDIDGTKIECSPLQYLLYVHDYYGQEIFEAYARKHNLLKEFVEHAHTQQTRFDLNPFCQVYETYLAILEYWRAHNPMEDNEANSKVPYAENFWREEVGSAQLRKLPRHMLKQMCAEERFEEQYKYEWNPQSKFNDSALPPQNGCFAYSYKGVAKVDVVDPTSLLGVDFALARGSPYFDRRSAILRSWVLDRRVIRHDLEVFKALFAVRQEQQLHRISRLEQELQVLESTKPSPQPTKHV